MRLFIAIELSESLQQAIHVQTAALRGALGPETVRWVAPGNVHLTLKFLGEVASDGSAALEEMLSQEASQVPAFDVSVSGVGAFPNDARPRVIWVGLHGPPALSSLRLAIERGARGLGYPAEERDFSPHLTLGRVRRGASSAELHGIHAALESSNIGQVGTAHVDAVCLFRSDLKPGGAVYTRLCSAPLASVAPVAR
jgi:2'-5' RNA ligase